MFDVRAIQGIDFNNYAIKLVIYSKQDEQSIS